ncbi:MAG: hypothetical protein RIQ71_1546 [Verrucomicrobiota bacterium]|jgi:hypothetical protein
MLFNGIEVELDCLLVREIPHSLVVSYNGHTCCQIKFHPTRKRFGARRQVAKPPYLFELP